MTRRHPHVVNSDELEQQTFEQGRHQIQFRQLGAPAGSTQLGGSVIEIAPGKISYPFHYHCANEEALFILAGSGTARIGDQRIAVRAGDWIAFPIGPDTAHQMINDSTEPLRYLAISTAHKCEVVGYPDSNKIGASGGTSFTNRWIRQINKSGDTMGYWDGEPDAQ